MILIGLLWATAIVVLVIPRPELSLDPTSLTVHRLTRPIQLPWAELAPGGPPPPAKWSLTLRVIRRFPAPNDPHHVRVEDIPVGGLRVDAAFLAATIRHYVEHPADRTNIGTAEGLTR